MRVLSGLRVLIFFLVIGGAAFMYGWNERSLASKAGSAPVAMDVADLEARGMPDKIYGTLGEHEPLYEQLIYSHDEKDKNSVDYCFYPIVSKKQVRATLEELAAKHKGGIDEVTNEEFYRAVPIKVIIKTKRYHNLDEIKREVESEKFPTGNIGGMIVNDVTSLTSQEENMLKSDCPKFDKTTLIFEQGRSPSSGGLAYGAMAGGAALIVLGLVAGLKTMVAG